MQAILSTLRDVDGVIGSFVLDAEGHPSARDLPSVVDDGALGDVGPRLGRLTEALEASGKTLDGCAMRFGAHQLYLRRCGEGLLCIVTREGCTAPALRMAAKLVAKRLDAQAVAAPASHGSLPPPPASLPPTPPPPIAAVEPVAEGPRPRFFRGRRID